MKSASATAPGRAASSARAALNAPRSPWRLAGIAATAALVAVHLVIYFVSLFVSPIGFDEAFILQAPLNLVQGLGYSTEDWLGGGANIAFDATVSTGPALGGPIALSFWMFGVSLTAARIATLPFFILLIVCLIVLGRRYAGWWGAAAALGTLVMIDSRVDFPLSVVYGPSDAIGEYSTGALLALALVLLPRHRRLTGLVLGAAMLVKFIAAMAIPAFMLALLLVPAARGLRWRTRVGELAAFVGFAAIPSVLWELIKLVSLGPAQYLVSLRSYLVFLFHSGSGVDGTNTAQYLDRASRFFAAWQIPTLAAIVVGSVVVALCVVGIWRRAADRGFTAQRGARWTHTTGSFLSRVGVDVVAAAATLGAFAVWWVFISSSVFVRHTIPILIVAVPLMSALAVVGLHSLVARAGAWRVVAVATIAVAVVITAFGATRATVASTESPLWTRADQQATAEFVAEHAPGGVQGIGWWAAPSVRFFSGVHSTPVGHGTGPLILEPITRAIDPAVYDFGLSLCRDVEFERNGFVVCAVDPDQAPLEQAQ